MRRPIIGALVLILGIFVVSAGQRPANAEVATAAIGSSQIQTPSDTGVTRIWYRGGWGYRRWGYGPGWGWGPGRYWAFGGPYWGPACRWHCGPYRCWRACW